MRRKSRLGTGMFIKELLGGLFVVLPLAVVLLLLGVPPVLVVPLLLMLPAWKHAARKGPSRVRVPVPLGSLGPGTPAAKTRDMM